MASSSQRHKATTHGLAPDGSTVGRVQISSDRHSNNGLINTLVGNFRQGYRLDISCSFPGTPLSGSIQPMAVTFGASNDGYGVMGPEEAADYWVANAADTGGPSFESVSIGGGMLTTVVSGGGTGNGLLVAAWRYVQPAGTWFGVTTATDTTIAEYQPYTGAAWA